MTQEEIIINNRLIAAFMGFARNPYYHMPQFGMYKPIPYSHDFDYVDIFEDRELQFHESWNWLMPVWAKIVNERDGIIDKHGQFLVKQIHRTLYIPNIEKSFKAIIDFIRWYVHNESPVMGSFDENGDAIEPEKS